MASLRASRASCKFSLISSISSGITMIWFGICSGFLLLVVKEVVSDASSVLVLLLVIRVLNLFSFIFNCARLVWTEKILNPNITNELRI